MVGLGGLIALFVLAQFAGFVLKIRSDGFYKPFHFAGGFLTAVLMFAVINKISAGQILFGDLAAYVLSLTVIVGILWEIYEWLLWRYFLKVKKLKPQRADTINDLMLDFLGGALAILILFLRR